MSASSRPPSYVQAIREVRAELLDGAALLRRLQLVGEDDFRAAVGDWHRWQRTARRRVDCCDLGGEQFSFTRLDGLVSIREHLGKSLADAVEDVIRRGVGYQIQPEDWTARVNRPLAFTASNVIVPGEPAGMPPPGVGSKRDQVLAAVARWFRDVLAELDAELVAKGWLPPLAAGDGLPDSHAATGADVHTPSATITAPTPDAAGLLADATAVGVKGNQLRLVRLLADGGGRQPIADILAAFDWPDLNGGKSTIRALQMKLRAAGWRFRRHDGCLIAEPFRGTRKSQK